MAPAAAGGCSCVEHEIADARLFRVELGGRGGGGRELWAVHDVGADEAVLFFWAWVAGCVAGVGLRGVVVVVAPFGEVVGEFHAGCVGRGVLEVDDDKLAMFVVGEEERRLAGGLEAQKVAILSLYELAWLAGK